MNWRFPFEFLFFFSGVRLSWIGCPIAQGKRERERGLVTLKKIQLRQGPFSEYLIISSCNDDSRASHFGSLFFCFCFLVANRDWESDAAATKTTATITTSHQITF
jgi:hypothetical protein